jgi:hypothetical protein
MRAAEMARPRAATPPKVPPAIAPTGVDLFDGGASVELVAEGVVEAVDVNGLELSFSVVPVVGGKGSRPKVGVVGIVEVVEVGVLEELVEDDVLEELVEVEVVEETTGVEVEAGLGITLGNVFPAWTNQQV